MLKITFALLVSSSALAATPDIRMTELKKTVMSENQHYSERWTAAMKLSKLNDPKAEKELVMLSQRKEWFLRNAALVGLQKKNPKVAYLLAKKLLKDPALVVRSAAVDVMRSRLEAQDRNLLWTEFKQKYNFRGNQSLWIRRDLAAALSSKPHPKEYKQFQSMLSEKDESIQYQGALALAKISGLYFAQEKMAPKELIANWKKQIARMPANNRATK